MVRDGLGIGTDTDESLSSGSMSGNDREPQATMHASRRARLREAVAARDAEAMLVTDPTDVAYLTGFLGGDSYLIVPTDPGARATVVTDFRYQEELEPLAGDLDIHIRHGSFEDALRELLDRAGVRRCGVQAEHMSLARFDALAEEVGAERLLRTTRLVGELRLRKDETEIDLIREAVRIQEQALRAVLPTIEPEQTELEIAARLEAEMKTRGSSEPGFNTIVASGANGSLPHHRPGTARVKMGKPLLIDWGAVRLGYHADMTRTFGVGGWSNQMREIYHIVLDAHLKAAEALVPGRTTHEIDEIARDCIAAHGYAERFGHGLGHGMGLDGHEDPRLNPLYEPSVLEPGHVVTIEPGIYLPGVGGVRIEDDFVVTEQGCENLCTLEKDLEWALLCAG